MKGGREVLGSGFWGSKRCRFRVLGERWRVGGEGASYICTWAEGNEREEGGRGTIRVSGLSFRVPNLSSHTCN